MKIIAGRFYKLKRGPVVEVTAVGDVKIKYLINGSPAQVLKKHFEIMAEREWAPPARRKPRKECDGEFK